MLASISVGSALIIVTTVVHAMAMRILLWQLQAVHAGQWATRSEWSRTTLVAAAVLGLFLASLVEMALWPT